VFPEGCLSDVGEPLGKIGDLGEMRPDGRGEKALPLPVLVDDRGAAEEPVPLRGLGDRVLEGSGGRPRQPVRAEIPHPDDPLRVRPVLLRGVGVINGEHERDETFIILLAAEEGGEFLRDHAEFGGLIIPPGAPVLETDLGPLGVRQVLGESLEGSGPLPRPDGHGSLQGPCRRGVLHERDVGLHIPRPGLTEAASIPRTDLSPVERTHGADRGLVDLHGPGDGFPFLGRGRSGEDDVEIREERIVGEPADPGFPLHRHGQGPNGTPGGEGDRDLGVPETHHEVADEAGLGG